MKNLKRSSLFITKFSGFGTPSRKETIIAAIAITAVIIIAYLASRQMFHYDNFSGAIIFGLTIVIGAAGSFIILKFVSKASADLRKRSLFFDKLFKVVITTTAVIFATFIAMFLGFYYYNTSVRYLAYFVFSLSTIVSVGIMIIIGFKFFSWYKVSAYKVSINGKSNYLLLMFGVAAASLAVAMAFDAGSKMLLLRVVEEGSPPDAIPEDMFIYRNDENYQGQLQYKVVTPETTELYIRSSSIKIIYSYLNGWIPITVSFVLTWAITTMLLRQYYHQRIGKMPVALLILLTVPLILYMIGRYTELYTVFSGTVWRWDDFQNAYLFRSIFRAGLIAGSVMFGVAFLVVARKIESGRIRDYFTIAAIGAMMMSITLAPSASQQTFGVAGRSLMLLASFMLCAGFYLSAFQMAQDANLRRLTKTSAGSKVFGEMGSAQFGQEIEKKVLNVLDKEEDQLSKEHTNIQPSSEQEDVKSYLDNVLDEVEQNKMKDLRNIPSQPRDFRDIL